MNWKRAIAIILQVLGYISLFASASVSLYICANDDNWWVLEEYCFVPIVGALLLIAGKGLLKSAPSKNKSIRRVIPLTQDKVLIEEKEVRL